MFIKIFLLVCVLQQYHTVSSLETKENLSSHDNPEDEEDEAPHRVRRQVLNSKFVVVVVVVVAAVVAVAVVAVAVVVAETDPVLFDGTGILPVVIVTFDVSVPVTVTVPVTATVTAAVTVSAMYRSRFCNCYRYGYC